MIAVLVKTVVQHGMSIVGGFLLLFATLVIGWALVLSQELTTMITAATATLYYVGPLYILFIADRLVAADRLDGTTEFLGALPMNVVHRLVLPWTLGWTVVVATFEICLLSTAVLASRREGLPASWLLQIHVQLGLYAFAWYNLAFAVAHTGRYRWLVWWLFFMAVFAVDGSWIDQPWRSILWMAPLADPVEQTRSVPPWDSAVIVFVWSAIAVVMTFVLESWRGGELASRWFAPATARQRAGIVVAGMIGLGVSDVPASLAPQPDAWSSLAPLPAARAEVRIAGRALKPVASAVIERLDRLGVEAGVDRWPGVVLIPTRGGVERQVRRAVGRSDVNLVLMVDPNAPQSLLVRDIVHHVLVRQTGDLGGNVDGVDALLHGIAGLDDLAAIQGLASHAAGVSYREIRVNRGRDVAGAVAALWVDQLPDRAEWMRAVLGSRRGSGVQSIVALRWAGRGLDEAFAATRDGQGLLDAPIVVRRDGGVMAQIPEGARNATLDVLHLDPLQPDPGLFDVSRRLPVRGREEVGLPLDPRQTFRVRLVRWDGLLQAWRTSPWVQ